MKNSDLIKAIRLKLQLSQTEFAAQLGVGFNTVNRWENGHFEPSWESMKAIKNLCAKYHCDYSQFEKNIPDSRGKTAILYHGSRSGLQGPITPSSSRHCDFGVGFYMGVEASQPLTTICNYPEGKLYTLKINMAELKTFKVAVAIDWALYIAYYRGLLEHAKDFSMYKRYEKQEAICDLVTGYVVDDRMFLVLDRFFHGEITDVALSQCHAALKPGRQYVALSPIACQRITILEEQQISAEQRQSILEESEINRAAGVAIIDEICRKYRRDGRYFDEIVKADK